MTRTRFLVALIAALVVSTIGFGQTTLGNMFQLGQSTTANLPTPSSTITGALIYDLDAGAPRYNTGTTWSLFGNSGASHWADAGTFTSVGGSYTHAAMAAALTPIVKTYDAGVGLVVTGATTGTSIRPALLITNNIDNETIGPSLVFSSTSSPDPSAAVAWLFASASNSGGINAGLNFHSASPFIWSIGGSGYGTSNTRIQTITGSAINGYMPFTSQVGSGSVGFSAPTTGVQWNVGAGTNDYFASDGTGIETPSYWESTRAFTAGPGVVTPRIHISGSDNTKFSSANAAVSSAGDLSYDTDNHRLMLQVDGGSFAPVGAPHLTYDKQTFTTRIIGVSGQTGAPQIAERVTADNAGSTLQTYWAGTGTGAVAAVLTSLDRTYYAIQPGTEANSRYFGTTATSAATTTLKPIVAARKSPAWCQPIRTGAAITSLRIWAGLVDTGTSTGTSTMNGNGVMFRYDTNVDGNWYLCSKDNTTQNCTSTGIAVATTTTYHLCIQLDSNRTMYGFINGVYVASSSTNPPSLNSELAPWVEVQILAGSTNAISVGVMQVESL